MSISDADLRQRVITGLVRALKQLGYPDCTEENVLADPLHGLISVTILVDLHTKATRTQAQRVAEALLAEIECNMDAMIDKAVEVPR